MFVHGHNVFSYTQCRDVTSRGVSGRLMRRSSDSGEAPERARKPPPSADYHLVRCIWQLGLTERPASFCMAGRERINSLLAHKGDTQIHLPLKMAARQMRHRWTDRQTFWVPITMVSSPKTPRALKGLVIQLPLLLLNTFPQTRCVFPSETSSAALTDTI